MTVVKGTWDCRPIISTIRAGWESKACTSAKRMSIILENFQSRYPSLWFESGSNKQGLDEYKCKSSMKLEDCQPKSPARTRRVVSRTLEGNKDVFTLWLQTFNWLAIVVIHRIMSDGKFHAQHRTNFPSVKLSLTGTECTMNYIHHNIPSRKKEDTVAAVNQSTTEKKHDEPYY